MITFFAPMNSLGYGVHSYGLMKALHDLGVKLALFTPYGNVNRPPDAYIKEWLQNQADSRISGPGVMIFHEGFMRQFSGTPRIGFPVFEMEKINAADLQALKSCDVLLQPSKWGKEILIQNGVTDVPIHVVPEGYDPETFYPDRSTDEMVGRMNEYVSFIHVGKWEARKSTREIIECFACASEKASRRAVLHLLINDPFNPDWQEDACQMLMQFGFQAGQNNVYAKDKTKIVLYPERLKTQHGVAALMSRTHFGIWASKAEGWNLPLSEAIGCGLPSFTTPWTGQSEYVMEGRWPEVLLFRNSQKISAQDGKWFQGERGTWRCPDKEEMIQKMTQVLQDPERFYREGRRTMEAIRGRLTWQTAAKTFIQVLKKEGVFYEH